MTGEYLWMGKYRVVSEVDPATYYPNGVTQSTEDQVPEGIPCIRLSFPIATNNTFFNTGNDLNFVQIPIYFEQQDISDDVFWRFSVVPNSLFGGGGLGGIGGCTGASISDPGFLIITGDFSPDMVLDVDTGKLLGKTGDLDFYASSLNIPPDYEIDEQNYGTVGSASYFRNGVGFGIPVSVTVRAFEKTDPSIHIDKTFTYTLRNNWSSDRDTLILNIKNQFYVDGKPATNLEYLEAQKAKGFFPGPP
jgi:hypothetical protein